MFAFISWLVSRKVWIHSHTIFLWHGEKQKQPLEVFTKFLEKHLCQSLFFNKVAGLRKKETLTRVFSSAKFSGTPFLQNTSGRLLLEKLTLNTKYLLELIKRRSKVQETIMSCKRALSFDQWKRFSENYKPMRIWLWFVYQFTESYYPSWLFAEFIQTQKRYPTCPDKIHILIQKLLVISR